MFSLFRNLVLKFQFLENKKFWCAASTHDNEEAMCANVHLKLKKKTRSWLGPVLVFWLIMIAYPLTVEFLQDKLEIGFFSVLWIAILISMMLATEDIFIEDYNDGTLEHIIIKNSSFQFLISMRIAMYWLMVGIPVSVLSFIFTLGTSEDLVLSLSIIPLSMISSYIFLN